MGLDGLPTSGVVSFRRRVRNHHARERGTAPSGRQSRGKMRGTVSPRTCNEGLRPLGRQARGKDDSHCPAHGGAAGDAEREKEKQTNRYIVAAGISTGGSEPLC